MKTEHLQQQFDRIVQAVADEFHVSPHAILGTRRDWEFALPRHVVVLLTHQMTEASRVEIAALMHRDRSTVDHSIRVAMDVLDTQPDLRARVNRLRCELDAVNGCYAI